MAHGYIQKGLYLKIYSQALDNMKPSTSVQLQILDLLDNSSTSSHRCPIHQRPQQMARDSFKDPNTVLSLSPLIVVHCTEIHTFLNAFQSIPLNRSPFIYCLKLQSGGLLGG